MKRPNFLAFSIAIFAAVTCPPLAAQDEPRSAEEILRLVRLSYALQDHKTQGRLRDEGTGKVEPLELTMSQQVIRFRFVNPPPEIVHLDLSTTPATLWQVKPGGTTRVPLSSSGQAVRGMDLNYEDLSLRFLYWQNAKLLGEDRVSTVKCWLLRVTAPDRSGPYGTVDLWVHKESGGIAKMEAWNFQSKMVKRFQVTKVQKIDKATVLKEMRIESINPATGAKGRTYLTMDTPERNR